MCGNSVYWLPQVNLVSYFCLASLYSFLYQQKRHSFSVTLFKTGALHICKNQCTLFESRTWNWTRMAKYLVLPKGSFIIISFINLPYVIELSLPLALGYYSATYIYHEVRFSHYCLFYDYLTWILLMLICFILNPPMIS